MIEIRGHARGGQGMVTGFEIMAKVFSKLGAFRVQAFPAFGVERTGAPIQAFLRVAKTAIDNRSNIYNPHLIVVFDESLLDQVPVFEGLRENGSVLINTDRPPGAFRDLAQKVYTIQATKISLELGLGSKSLPIVNAAMIGAIMRLFNADIDVSREVISQHVPVKHAANARAAQIAYSSVQGLDQEDTYLVSMLHTQAVGHASPEDMKKIFDELKPVEPDTFQAPYWSDPMSQNKTGNWRLMTPSYITKMPPCTANCPAGTDVRAFVQRAGEGKFEEAYQILYAHNPFPGICGRVCPHFCEQNCNRLNLDSGLNVGGIERFLGDHFHSGELEPVPLGKKTKIAVVGSGPAGLTAALRLRNKGYPVTVFEAHDLPGGMMRTGIPKFRLPDHILDTEIQAIRDQGVEIQTGRKVTVKELEEQGFDGIVTAVGSHIGYQLGFADGQRVLDGITFLRRFKLLEETCGVRSGDQVAIVGGGNTAIDVARTVLRLGADPTIYYRRTIAEMPAIAKEVEEALAEGVRIRFLTAPVDVRAVNARSLEVIFQKMKPGAPDRSGRRRPVPIEGAQHMVQCHHLIAAIGQQFDHYVFQDDAIRPVQGRLGENDTIPVFCAGDMAWGGTVAEAIGSGNKAAEEVDKWFEGLPYTHKDVLPEVVLPEDINYAYYMSAPRHQEPVRLNGDLVGDFSEIAGGLTAEEVMDESARCLHCGECFNCGNCFNYCPDAAIYIDDAGRIRIDYQYCKGCGICAQECPCSAIEFQLIEEEVIP